MAGNAFRVRGVRIVVDTTAEAEFDLAGYQIADATMQRIGNRLETVPFPLKIGSWGMSA